jgi:hypothetical protein
MANHVKALIKLGSVRALMLSAVLAVVMLAQEKVNIPVTAPAIDLTPTGMTKDVWFWIFVGWYIFSALVTGMPEPTQESSPWYIWAYRSFHILAASGTSFFQNKMYWPNTAIGPTVTSHAEEKLDRVE